MNNKEDQNKRSYAEDDGPVYSDGGSWQLWEIVLVILMLIGLCMMSIGGPIIGLIFF